MKREIKFRAWIFEENKMSFQDEWFSIWAFDGIQYADQGYWTNNMDASESHKEELRKKNIEIKDEFVLMQYTGLKDKNGKEIYEGDIVKLDEAPDIIKGTEFHNMEDVSHHEIYWDNDRACFCDKRLEDGDSLAGYLDGDISFMSDCELVGNIYENAELLNGQPNNDTQCGDGG